MPINPMRRDWNRFQSEWDITYNANIVEKPYSGTPAITIPQREATITGTIERQIIHHQADFDELVAWFADGGKILRCPIFNTAPVVAGDMANYVGREASGLISVFWTYKGVLTPYRFRSIYFLGTLATTTGNLLIAPVATTKYDFGVLIRPKSRGFTYNHRSKNQWEIDAIEFYVVPHAGWYIGANQPGNIA